MQILDIIELEIPDVKVIRFKKFCDDRGYFTETFRKEDFFENPDIDFFDGYEFLQFNEAFSFSGTFRGLHFQWDPFMGKLVRCISGRLIDYALDIRKDSPYFGKIVGFDLKADRFRDCSEWIWLPPGFAHGTLLTDDSYIQYLCSGTYNPNGESVIRPNAPDIDWSICNTELAQIYRFSFEHGIRIKDRDLQGETINEWANNPNSEKFCKMVKHVS